MAGQAEEFDFASLPILDEGILLEGLRHRYERDSIYSYVGDILLAVNPFQDLDIYGAEYTRKYQQVELRWTLPPHIYAVADAAYQALCNYHDDQCCIISGESGAGKTESAKLIVHHVINLCRCNNDLQQQILQVNPLLEAFGNARTVMNNNSSRFGKFLELQFDSKFTVMGAKLTEYLLEKSRVVSQAPGESNFHIFYYLSAGLNEEQKKTLQLHGNHRYIASKQCKEEEKILTHLENRNSFDVVCHCFGVVGFSKEEIHTIFSILAAILHIGDVQFRVRKSEEAIVQNKSVVSSVIKLLDLDPVEFEQSLVTTITTTRGESICRLHTLSQAEDTRDATAKALYGRLFAWIVFRINQTLCHYHGKKSKAHHTIAILDIFGFENFKQNSFEQLCINVANEQLQFYFNQHIFAWEKEQYANEGIVIKENITYINNKPLCDLFLKKPIGLLTLLDEESKFPQATDNSLVLKFNRHFSKNDYYLSSQDGRAVSFAIRHYAGKVTYNAKGFLEKNRDSLSNNMTDCLKASGCEFVSEMFLNKLTRTGSMLRRTTQILNMDRVKDKTCLPGESKKTDIKSATMVIRRPTKEDVTLRRQQSMERRRGSITVAANTLSRPMTKGPMTLANNFRNSLSDLMEKMLASSPHFVRCIKPNRQQVARDLDSDFVMKQLRYTGVMESIRIRRHGYPTRLSFADFVERYKLIIYGFTDHVEPSKRVCQAILKCSSLQGWQVGKTKVFLKCQHAESLMAIINNNLHKVFTVQNAVRSWCARRIVAKLRDQAATELVAIETMMESIVMSGQWDKQCELHKTDVMITKHQLHLVETVMTQVTTSSAECYGFLQKLDDEDNKLCLNENNLIAVLCSEIAMSSVAIQQQLCTMSHEDSRNVLTEERQVEEFLCSVTHSTLTCKEHLDKMAVEDTKVANDNAKQLASLLSMVSFSTIQCYQWQQLLCQQDKIHVTEQELVMTQFMTQADCDSTKYYKRLVILNEEDERRHKEWERMVQQLSASSAAEGVKTQQNMKFEGDRRTSVTTVDNTLLTTVQDHMTLCYPTPCTPSNKPRFGVLCFEDNICLGEYLLSSPVLVIDGSTDDSIISRIGFGSFPNCNPTSSHVEQRNNIGLGIMINCDDQGDVWVTRLSKNDDVIVITDGNHHSNHVLALPKGHPTMVFSINDFMLKMNTSDATFNAIPNLNDAILSSYCFVTIYFSDQVSTARYHSVVYLNDAISLLAEKLETSRDVLLSTYFMTKYGSGHSLELLKDGHEEEVGTTEDCPSVQVLGWRVVTIVCEQ